MQGNYLACTEKVNTWFMTVKLFYEFFVNMISVIESQVYSILRFVIWSRINALAILENHRQFMLITVWHIFGINENKA